MRKFTVMILSLLMIVSVAGCSAGVGAHRGHVDAGVSVGH